jgi:hypothetical protein
MVVVMNISQFNYIESGLWFALSIALMARLFKEGSHSRFCKLLVLSASTFFVFGLSDVIEANTGAWWRPWWLLLMKGLCVVSFVVCFIWYRRLTARGV